MVLLVSPITKVKTIWNVVLGLVDIVRCTNSYYKLQLLESDKGRQLPTSGPGGPPLEGGMFVKG